MDTRRGRTGRTPAGVKPTAAIVAVALMGMGGVALAAPKDDPGPPEQANGNGPPPQAQAPAPQAQAAPPPATPAAPQAKAKEHGSSSPAKLPTQPPQAGGGTDPGSAGGQSSPGEARGGRGYHGRPAPGENRGHGPKSSRGRGCQAAKCQGATPQPSAGPSAGGDVQPTPTGGQPGAEGDPPAERPDERDPGAEPDEWSTGAVPESGSVLGLNQGGGEEEYVPPSTFNGALPFTGSEIALLTALGALLGLAGIRLYRQTA
jgi:hypothetical protein